MAEAVGSGEADLVNPGAVGAAQIRQDVGLLRGIPADAGMVTGGFEIVQAQIVVFGAADAQPAAERLPGSHAHLA